MNILNHNKSKPKTSQTPRAKSLTKSFERVSPPKIKRDNKTLVESLKMFEVPHLTTLNQQFHKNIELPIDAQTSVFMAKTPQRCLHHNNVITLYCINDHKPLCVTCMYQNNAHKKHRVTPINRATKQLEEETSHNLRIIGKELENINFELRNTHSHLQKTEKEFPDLINKIQKFYMQLHQLLVQKKQEQIDHIKQTWGRIRYQYSTLAGILDKINIYTLEKVAAIQYRSGDEHLLFNRNISSHLAHLPQILPYNISSYRQTKYETELRRFQQVKNVINNSLIFTSPFQEVVSRSSSLKKSPNHFKERATLIPTPKKSPQRQQKENKQNNKLKETPSKSPHRDTSLTKSGSFRKY